MRKLKRVIKQETQKYNSSIIAIQKNNNVGRSVKSYATLYNKYAYKVLVGLKIKQRQSKQ